jgi:hypothetical protein
MNWHTYTEAMERSLMVGVDEVLAASPSSAHCSIPLQCPLLYINKPKYLLLYYNHINKFHGQ